MQTGKNKGPKPPRARTLNQRGSEVCNCMGRLSKTPQHDAPRWVRTLMTACVGSGNASEQEKLQEATAESQRRSDPEAEESAFSAESWGRVSTGQGEDVQLSGQQLGSRLSRRTAPPLACDGKVWAERHVKKQGGMKLGRQRVLRTKKISGARFN